MNSPTLSVHATMQGVILGTAAYMSPEQARGKSVDKRADIWAFGVVLYEMLTGTRAFAGDDISITLASVLKDQVRWAALPSDTPPRLRRLLERCLDRDVKQRLRDIGEARVELSALATSADAGLAAVTMSRASPSRLRWIAAGVVVGTAATALAFWAWRAPASLSAGLERTRFRLTLPPNVELSVSGGGAVSVSPDGRSIAFVGSMDGKAQLWLRSLDADDARLLAGTDGATVPFWSPDSASIGFFAGAKLKRLEIRTGTVQSICDVDPNGGGGATWNRDHVILFSPMLEGSLFRVPAGGGTPVQVTTLDAANRESNHMWPDFLPDGRHFLFQIFGLSNAGLYVGTIDGPARQLVVRQESLDVTAVQYAPSGQVSKGRSMYARITGANVGHLHVAAPRRPCA